MAKNDRTEAAVALSPLLTSAALEALRRHPRSASEMARRIHRRGEAKPNWRCVSFIFNVTPLPLAINLAAGEVTA